VDKRLPSSGGAYRLAFYLAWLWNYGYAPQRQSDPGPPAGADARPASSLEMLKEEKQMSQTPRNKMLTRMEEVRAQVAERDELIEIIAIALLTRKNVFILGDTGQAKSAVINLFRAGITGANQFERLMSKQTDEEALFGRLDLSSLIPGGVPEEELEKAPTKSWKYSLSPS